MAILALLMAGTSWAVASWVSPWLVPPYLILMALLLSPSTGRPQGEPTSEGSDSLESLRSARPAGGGPDDPDLDDGRDSTEPSEEDGSEPGSAAKAPRARRGKGRARKAKPLPEPTEASWIQVGPGKFVRVEASDETTGQAGPHASVGISVEVPTAPQLQEFEDGEPSGRFLSDPSEGLDPLEGTEGDPTGEIESEFSTDQERDEPARSSGTLEDAPAADGIAPQSGEILDASATSTPDVPLEEVEDRTWDDPTGEATERPDDPSSGLEIAQPTGPHALTDVCSEDVDEWRATLDGTDPTETTVDETDLDDAGPLEVVIPREITTSDDADPSATPAQPEPPDGPSRWPRRLVPWARIRVEAPPRSSDRETPPRRPVRSHGPARRPLDPRRLARRGLGRPRQVNRSFPPRSPPSGRVGRGGLMLLKMYNCVAICMKLGDFLPLGATCRSLASGRWSVAR